MATAKITSKAGRFEAEISSLTPTNAFLRTDRPLAFRERVQLELFDVRISAEVVFVSQQEPTGVGVVYSPSANQREVLERASRELGGPAAAARPGGSAPAIDSFLAALQQGGVGGAPPPSAPTGPGGGQGPGPAMGQGGGPGIHPGAGGHTPAPGGYPPSPGGYGPPSGGYGPPGGYTPVPGGYPGQAPTAPNMNALPGLGAAPGYPQAWGGPNVPTPMPGYPPVGVFPPGHPYAGRPIPGGPYGPRTGEHAAVPMPYPPYGGTPTYGGPVAPERTIPPQMPGYGPAPVTPIPSAPQAGTPTEAPPAAPVAVESAPSQAVSLSEIVDGVIRYERGVELYAVLLALRLGLPVVVRGASPGPVELEHGEHGFTATAVRLVPGLLALQSKSGAELNGRIAKLFEAMGPEDLAITAPEPEPPGDHVPELSADGTQVRFDSFAHFVVQHRTSLSQGALVVRATNLPPGTTRSLRLVIPGVDDALTVNGSVAFQGNGTIGFMIGGFDSVKARLAAIADRPPPPRVVASVRPAPAGAASAGASEARPPDGPQMTWSGRLRTGQGIGDVYDFAARRPADLSGANGWLARVLDHLFAKNVHGVLALRQDDKSLELWVHDGSVVFTRLVPSAEPERIGRVLVMQKRVSRNVLQSGLDRAKELAQPVGRTLVGMGELEPGALNAALRTQMMDRIFAAVDWPSAKAEVRAWSDPPVKTGLVILPGRTIMASILREQLRRAGADELDAFFEPNLDRTTKVDLDKIDPAFALRKKERRFLEKAVALRTPLRDLPKGTATPPADTWRMVALGRALEFLEIGAPARKKTESELAAEQAERLERRLEQTKRAHAFDVLSLHWTASPEEIPRAHATLKKALSVARASSDARLSKAASALITAIDAAFAELEDQAKRTALRHKITPPEEREPIALDILDKAEMSIVKEDFDGAEAMIRTAREIFDSPRVAKVLQNVQDAKDKLLDG